MSNADPRGKFVWHELQTADSAAASAFYPKIVSWKPQPWEHNPAYTTFVGKSGGHLGGAMSLPEDANGPAHWLPYVGVEDIHASVAQAKSLGAKVVKDVTDLPDGGTYCVLTDPQGAEFGVLKMGAEYKGASGATGEFSWHELTTSDADAAMSFYSRLFGWEVGPKHDMGPMGFYHLFNQDGVQYGGMFKSPQGDPPAWVLYVRVDDVGKATAAVKAGGGRVLNGPMEVPGGSWVAQVMDPEGVMFAVHDDSAATVAASAAAAEAKPAAAAKPKAPKKPAAEAPAAASSAPEAVAAEPAAPSKPAAPAKPRKAPAAKPAAAAAPAATPAPAAKPAAKSAPSPKATAQALVSAPPVAKKAPVKAAPARKAVAKKAAAKKAPAKKAPSKKASGKTAGKASAKTAGKKVAKKAAGKVAKKASGKVAKKAAGKKKSAAKRAPAKKASAAKRSAPAKKAKKHR